MFLLVGTNMLLPHHVTSLILKNENRSCVPISQTPFSTKLKLLLLAVEPA